MIRVCIESPFRPNAPRGTPEAEAELARNIAYARALMLDSLRRGEAGFASHLLYPQVLAGGDDSDPAERQLGIDAGTEWAKCAELIVVGVDLGVSEGMRKRLALLNPQDFEYRSLPEWRPAATDYDAVVRACADCSVDWPCLVHEHGPWRHG